MPLGFGKYTSDDLPGPSEIHQDLGLYGPGCSYATGLTFELKLCVPHDLHPIRCAELGHMFSASVWLIG